MGKIIAALKKNQIDIISKDFDEDCENVTNDLQNIDELTERMDFSGKDKKNSEGNKID